MDVRVELVQLLISELRDSQVIVLRERDGERTLRIVIGAPEIHAINRRIRGEIPARPLTHDLLANVVSELGGDIERIVIHALQEHTFFAKIVIRHLGSIVEVDSRPSDAIALGVAGDVPIYVSEQVLDEAGEQT